MEVVIGIRTVEQSPAGFRELWHAIRRPTTPRSWTRPAPRSLPAGIPTRRRSKPGSARRAVAPGRRSSSGADRPARQGPARRRPCPRPRRACRSGAHTRPSAFRAQPPHSATWRCAARVRRTASGSELMDSRPGGNRLERFSERADSARSVRRRTDADGDGRRPPPSRTAAAAAPRCAWWARQRAQPGLRPAKRTPRPAHERRREGVC